ncbi:MAG: hypothetical protein BJ554DRAFT_7622 [Olpidium bornovanus]|uniref:Retrotransposon gag domain-containing protein n=1 Tax=Olpidium bornovanus TaxID=278681 RepID=A0A8H8DJB0_9FUNG|nr:MAG: hypothetical protein BJ554DRAFT_7622 [Olpidium bornovanus]
MTGLSEKSRRIGDSVLLQREQAKEEKRRRVRENADAEMAALRDRVASFQREMAVMEDKLQDLQDTVEELVSSDLRPDDENTRGTENRDHSLYAGRGKHHGSADSIPSGLVVRALLASVPQFVSPGGAVIVTDFIEKMETSTEAGRFNPAEALALATNKLGRQASLLWRSHSKNYRRGSHGRWTEWEELLDTLYQQYHRREHQKMPMKDLANLSQAKCDGDIEKYIETFNYLYLQIPIPRDEQFSAMRFHSGRSCDEKIRVMLMTPEFGKFEHSTMAFV